MAADEDEEAAGDVSKCFEVDVAERLAEGESEFGTVEGDEDEEGAISMTKARYF